MGQAKKARDWQIDERRVEVARLLVKGWTERRIAAELGISPATAHRDAESIATEWAETRLKCGDRIRAVELQKLAEAESVALEVMSRTSAGDGDGTVDPDVVLRAADRVVKTQERRAKLLGLDAAIDVQVTQRMSAEVDAVLEALRGRLSAEAFDDVVAALGGGSAETEEDGGSED